MKEIKAILKEKKREAKELMQKPSSPEQHEGLGMMSVIIEIQSAMLSKTPKRFLNADNTVVKDGYVYVKIKDIPFGNV